MTTIKLSKLYIYSIGVSLFLLTSCARSLPEKLTDGNFKFWYSHVKEPSYLSFDYFDIKGKWKMFEDVPHYGFREYDGGDYILSEEWHIIGDSILRLDGSQDLRIIELTQDVMIFKSKFGRIDTLYAAPDSMIPKKFRHRW